MRNGWMLLGGLLLVACGSSSSARESTELNADGTSGAAGAAGDVGELATACDDGYTRPCTGPGACEGGQVCGADGKWGECDCGEPAGQAGNGSGNATGTGDRDPRLYWSCFFDTADRCVCARVAVPEPRDTCNTAFPCCYTYTSPSGDALCECLAATALTEQSCTDRIHALPSSDALCVTSCPP